MYTSIIRYALTLTFCTFAYGGWAQGEYLINEDFSGLTRTEKVDKEKATSLKDWEFYEQCKGNLFKDDVNNLALKIEGSTTGNSYTKGYAITKALNYEGDVYLYFLHAKTNSNDKNVKLDLSILVNGKFIDTNSDSRTVNVTKTVTEKTATAENFTIVNVTKDTKIKFETPEKKFFAIDDVIVSKIPSITIDEKENNSDKLEANTTKTVNTVRTLLGGIWNTLCLPFDVSMADLELALGKNQDIQVRTFHSYDSKTKVMTFVDPFGGETPLSTIPAGTPFLIKLNSDVVNPTFHAVTISNTAAQSIGEKGSVQFVGTYSPVELATDGTNIFITKDNTLALPAEGKNTMNGLRAYIVVPKDFNSSSARLLMDDGETASVSDLAPSVETGSKATYSLNGQRVENVRRGLYVVNGKLTLVK